MSHPATQRSAGEHFLGAGPFLGSGRLYHPADTSLDSKTVSDDQLIQHYVPLGMMTQLRELPGGNDVVPILIVDGNGTGLEDRFDRKYEPYISLEHPIFTFSIVANNLVGYTNIGFDELQPKVRFVSSAATTRLPDEQYDSTGDVLTDRLIRFERDQEDDTTSDLQDLMDTLFENGGSASLTLSTKDAYMSRTLSPTAYGAYLRSLGRVVDGPSLALRLQTLVDALRDAHPAVRDAAAVGLAALGSHRALQALQDAATRERLPLLRQRLSGVAAQLLGPT